MKLNILRKVPLVALFFSRAPLVALFLKCAISSMSSPNNIRQLFMPFHCFAGFLNTKIREDSITNRVSDQGCYKGVVKDHISWCQGSFHQSLDGNVTSIMGSMIGGLQDHMSKLIENRSSKKNIFVVRSHHKQMIENISKKSTRSARSHLHLKVIRDSKEIIKITYSTVQHSTERYPADHKDATFQNSSCSTTVEPKRRDFSQQLISCSSFS